LATTDAVLPEARLRLVDAERGPLPDRSALDGLADPLLVEAVAALVHRPEERLGEVALAQAGRQPHVARPEGGAEGVGRLVLAASLEVEAHPAEDGLAELPLPDERVAALEDRAVDRPAGGADPVEQRDGVGAQPPEHLAQAGRGRA